jgi:hypothetical protein
MVIYRCSDYGEIYVYIFHHCSAHTITILVNDECAGVFTVPPFLQEGEYWLGNVSVPKTPFKWVIKGLVISSNEGDRTQREIAVHVRQ